jgi:hypothetical protein
MAAAPENDISLPSKQQEQDDHDHHARHKRLGVGGLFLLLCDGVTVVLVVKFANERVNLFVADLIERSKGLSCAP